MAENWCGKQDRYEIPERRVTLTVAQLRLVLEAFTAAGAHEPEGCSTDCPAPIEHDAVTLVRAALLH